MCFSQKTWLAEKVMWWDCQREPSSPSLAVDVPSQREDIIVALLKAVCGK